MALSPLFGASAAWAIHAEPSSAAPKAIVLIVSLFMDILRQWNMRKMRAERDEAPRGGQVQVAFASHFRHRPRWEASLLKTIRISPRLGRLAMTRW
jgi:hypothetical protein